MKYFTTITKKLNVRTVSYIMAVLFILSILPMLIISGYTQPYRDDFWYGVPARNAFMERGSVIDAIGGSIDGLVHQYQVWQGTFSAIFLMGLQPAVFGEQYYGVTGIFMLLILIVSTFVLLSTICKYVLNVKRIFILFFSLPMLFFGIQYLDAVNSLFWYNASIFYIFYYSLMQFMVSLFIKLLIQKSDGLHKIRRIFSLVLTGLLCFWIGGGNFVTALLCVLLAGCALIYCFIKRLSTQQKITFAIFFAMVAGALLISVMAPGNSVRQETFNSPNLIRTLFSAVKSAAQDVYSWTNLKILALLLLFSPVFYSITVKMNCKFRCPWAVFLFTLLLYTAQYVPPFFAMNHVGPDRLRNIVYMAYIWFIMINGFYFVGWLGQLMRKHDIDMNKFPRPQGLALMAIVLVVFLGANVATIKNTSTYKCTRDLLNGVASRFAAEMNVRYELLNDPNIQDVVLKPIENFTDTIYRDGGDITNDPNFWFNQEVANYYQKNSVVLGD